MECVEREFIPVVLGGDINTYSVARAFYEEYQVKTYIFGKYSSGPSYNSKIIEYTANPKIETQEGFLETILSFGKKHEDKTIILLGAGDAYIALISQNKERLPKNVVAPYIDYELMNRLQRKDVFYELCDKHGVDYPDTFVHTPDMGYDFELNFSFPVILKSSESITYWEHPFEGQKKVFLMNSREELEETMKKIYGAGYENALIIQDTVPGNDEYMYVLTSYSDKNAEVKMMCLGHVLLEEHTPLGLGNHAAIITEANEELARKAKALLEDLQYVGFSNFDIKYDTRDGKYKFFEINTRQGRSNYYVTGSGFNIAKYLVEDYVYGTTRKFEMAKENHLWMVVPKGVAFKYVKDEKTKELMHKLIREDKYVNPLFFKGDLRPGRLYHLLRSHFSHYIKYQKYYK
ncbi:D-aspartate ligase [Aequitasia blattaphilus]|uniref:ATP-grasp domain-containing protein n=1 Tax=Aequitasia blattaphilus TaxID=2949332 RepID=A0ABT1EBE6_9FIRM|nr:ATP-grasp domain-containing protein [Aequitasia blattaphilus]MCP1103160.1 ATP-grasp domain-containing protein [Aequitasia blattaphilus]MCR8615800.1 ATP-grasp domain-containing protein [Aequitasia blattaphilus]